MIHPIVSVCSEDLRDRVLCCSCCGKCGEHLHESCGQSSGFACMNSPQIANCSDCGNSVVLCCSSCGNCGEHSHSEC